MSEDIFDWKPHPHHAFHVHDGPDLLGLKELLAFLPKMTDAQFNHHVTPHKNDFAKWIEVLNGEGSVSKLIRDARTKEEMHAALEAKRLEYLERKEKLQEQASAAQLPPKQEEKIIEKPLPPPPVQQQQEMGLDIKPASGVIGDEEFGKLHDEYTKKNEGLQDRFDTIAQRLKDSLDDPMPEDMVKEGEQIKERYEELRARISELRKQGKDLLLPALMIRRVPAKLAWAKAVRERKAFEEVRTLLDAVKVETDEVERAKELDIKKEVLALAGISVEAKE